jgi:hypothetical protein
MKNISCLPEFTVHINDFKHRALQQNTYATGNSYVGDLFWTRNAEQLSTAT